MQVIQETNHFDLNIEEILESWEIYDGLREIISNDLDEQLLTQAGDKILGISAAIVYSALVIILDLISLGAGVFAAFIGLDISGTIRRSLGSQFQVLNPILDVLPYIVLFLGIAGTISDVVSLGSALIEFENGNEE